MKNGTYGHWTVIHVNTQSLADRIAESVNALGTGEAWVNRANSRRVFKVCLKGRLSREQVVAAQDLANALFDRFS